MNKIKEMEERYLDAIMRSDYFAVQEIVSELNALSIEEKKLSRDLYEKIEDDLFLLGIETPNNYDLVQFQNEIAKVGKKVRKDNTLKDIVNIKDVNDVFCGFQANSSHILQDLKYHFVFHLNKNDIQNVNLLLLTDENFSDNPLVDKIFNANRDLNPSRYKIMDFIEQIKHSTQLLNSQYLLILVISPTPGEKSSTLKKLDELFKKFDNCFQINVAKEKFTGRGDYSFKNVDRVTYEEIEKITSNILNNKAISHDEEKVIKLCISNSTAITDYKILKAGFSGAKVIEVRPIRYVIAQEPVRFVIKFSYKNEERKLQQEKQAFKRYLQELNVQGYTCDYVETELCEAIQYNYASSDSVMDSYSFATLIDDSLLIRPKHKHNLPDTISQLFDCKPFEKWQESVTSQTKAVSTYYKKYLDEEKIAFWISMIENKTQEEVKISILWKQYEKIMSHALISKEKVCHGDLHSENLFKDDEDVYLIDFGYTSENHAIIDHSTLETSIKFKHIPLYIPLAEVLDIEKKMFAFESFDESFDLGFIERPKLRGLFELIRRLRKTSVPFLADEKEHLEYLISLFILTFRQIQYKDMNQRYALESAKLLAAHIMKFI